MSAGGELRRIQRSVKSLPRKWAEESAKTIRKAAEKRLTTDTGGDRSLSNAPGKIRVTSKVSGGDNLVTATIEPAKRSMGIYTWLEHGTDPHINQGLFPGTQHPGTDGKGTWTKAVAPEVKALRKDAHKRFEEVMR